MIQLIFRLLLIATVVTLVEAAPRRVPATCKTLKCPVGRICVKMTSAICGIPHGKPCEFNDICEGGYYCLNKKTCSGSGLLPYGSACQSNNCEAGLYCDQKEKKCLHTSG